MLTQKQKILLDFIQKRVEINGVSPSFDEMRDALGLKSKSGIHRLITALEERGYIRRLAHKARAIEIIKMPELKSPRASAKTHKAPSYAATTNNSGHADLPVMGQIAAGTPIEAIQNVSRHISVPPEMISQGNHYALEVRGESMIEAGIFDGDVVIIREQITADNGQIIVALIDGQEATLKTLRKKGSIIALEAANPAFETQEYDADDVSIQGRLVGLVRAYN